MAIDSAYATAEQYRTALKSDDDDAHDVAIDRNLESISRYLDWKLHEKTGFNIDAAATVREYVGTGYPDIEVHSIASKTDLAVVVDEDGDGEFTDDTSWTSSDFKLRPLNADVGPLVKPWTELYIPFWSTKTYWPRGLLIQVTARHGWPEVPTSIVDATIQLAAMLRDESVFATMQIQQIDQAVAASPQARAVIKGLSQALNRQPVQFG